MRNSLIIAAVIFLAYSLFLAYGPKPVKAKMQSQWQDNRYAIETYLRDSKAAVTQHQVVLVGSSLTKRLSFDEDSRCVFNLAFNGDSALTGLSVIANSYKPPRAVFVEINVPSLGSNQELIAQSSGLLPQLSTVFHIENMPMNLAISYLYSSRNRDSERDVIEVTEPVRHNAIAHQVLGYENTLPSDILDKNMSEFNRLVKVIESKGTRVIFFEMPIFQDLEYSPRAVQTRKAFNGAFPFYEFLTYQDLGKGGIIKTSDGLHLLRDEAKNVSSNMRRYLNDFCTTQNGHQEFASPEIR
jgi:hypothetical protein